MKGAGIVSSGAELPPIPPVTGNRRNRVPSWGRPLPYPIIIADRRNNRLIEVTPDKRIVWEMPSADMVLYRGNEDVSFSPDGKLLAVSEEDNYDIHIVDYEKRAGVKSAPDAGEARKNCGFRAGTGHAPVPGCLTSDRGGPNIQAFT